jgi:hypothetical protein
MITYCSISIICCRCELCRNKESLLLEKSPPPPPHTHTHTNWYFMVQRLGKRLLLHIIPYCNRWHFEKKWRTYLSYYSLWHTTYLSHVLYCTYIHKKVLLCASLPFASLIKTCIRMEKKSFFTCHPAVLPQITYTYLAGKNKGSATWHSTHVSSTILTTERAPTGISGAPHMYCNGLMKRKIFIWTHHLHSWASAELNICDGWRSRIKNKNYSKLIILSSVILCLYQLTLQW